MNQELLKERLHYNQDKMLIITVDESARKEKHIVAPGDEYNKAGALPGTVVLSPEKYEEFISQLTDETLQAA